MSTLIVATTAPSSAETIASSSDNPAVVRCCAAWQEAHDAELAHTGSNPHAQFAASRAYRDSMPTLDGFENIRDFIACTAQAMLLGAITESKGTKLLYAAQVALGTVRYQPAPKVSTKA